MKYLFMFLILVLTSCNINEPLESQEIDLAIECKFYFKPSGSLMYPIVEVLNSHLISNDIKAYQDKDILEVFSKNKYILKYNENQVTFRYNNKEQIIKYSLDDFE